jgi:hypothetical protein
MLPGEYPSTPLRPFLKVGVLCFLKNDFQKSTGQSKN